LAQIRGDLRQRFAFRAQDRVAVFDNFENHGRSIEQAALVW
jgi:hypothetical protein